MQIMNVYTFLLAQINYLQSISIILQLIAPQFFIYLFLRNMFVIPDAHPFPISREISKTLGSAKLLID